MKICFVHPTDLEKNNNSITNYIRGIIEYSYSKKLDVIYVGIPENSNKSIDLLARYSCFSLGKSIKKKFFLPPTFIYIISLYKFIIKNKKLLKGRILSFHQTDSALPFLFPIKLGSTVVTIHGFHGAAASLKRGEDATFYGRLKIFIFNLIEESVIKKADKIIVVSQERYHYYISKYPDKMNKIIFIPPFIDNKKFFFRKDKQFLRKKYGILKNDLVLLYLGRIVKEKNIDLIVKSFKKISKMYNDKKLKLLLVGNGDFKKEIEGIITEEKIENILLINEISHDLIPEIMNCANIFILISSFEGTPISVLEALSCGVPVIASKVGDLPKLISNGVNGYLTNGISESELINAINYIIELNPDPYKCTESIKRYWDSNVIPMILKEYSKIFL